MKPFFSRGCIKTVHGMCGTPTYTTWLCMIGRCYHPANDAFARYGAKGIVVCDRWKDFQNFFADMGERPEGQTLDRIDSKGNYEPSNCRWATGKEQHRNKSSNRLITAFGRTQCLSAWAEEFGIDKRTLRSRLVRGNTSPEDALTKSLANHKERGLMAAKERWGYSA